MFYNGAVILYYRACQKEEISRLVPALKVETVFVLLLSFLFLGEILSPVRYGGIALLIIGAVIISFKAGKRPAPSAVAMVMGVGILIALRNIVLKVAGGQDLFAVLAWVGMGGLLVGIVLFGIHHPHIRRKAKKGIEHLVLINVLSIAFFLLFTWAVSLAPVSMVSAVISSQVLFVFLIALFLSKTHMHIIKEEMRESTLLLKGAALGLIILGLVLMV